MLDQKNRLLQAQRMYQAGLQKVVNSPEPEGQKFPCGSRVRIVDNNLGAWRCVATVKYVYAHAYGGSDTNSYCLDIDGVGEVSWYKEHQLMMI